LLIVFIFRIVETSLKGGNLKSLVAIISAAIAVSFISCSDDKTTTPGPTPSAYRNLTVSMDGMSPHVDQLMEFSVASGANLYSRAVLDPLPAVQFSFMMNDALPEQALRLDFFADLNGNGNYNPPPADHAWRIALSDTGDVTVNFTHNISFTDISDTSTSDSGAGFRAAYSGFTPHVGQLFELKVIRADSGQVVGYYRLGAVPNSDFDIEIRDIIKDGEDYQVDFYADLNGNGIYDAPPADHAWRTTGTGTANGLDINFGHNTTFTDIGF